MDLLRAPSKGLQLSQGLVITRFAAIIKFNAISIFLWRISPFLFLIGIIVEKMEHLLLGR